MKRLELHSARFICGVWRVHLKVAQRTSNRGPQIRPQIGDGSRHRTAQREMRNVPQRRMSLGGEWRKGKESLKKKAFEERSQRVWFPSRCIVRDFIYWKHSTFILVNLNKAFNMRCSLSFFAAAISGFPHLLQISSCPTIFLLTASGFAFEILPWNHQIRIPSAFCHPGNKVTCIWTHPLSLPSSCLMHVSPAHLLRNLEWSIIPNVMWTLISSILTWLPWVCFLTDLLSCNLYTVQYIHLKCAISIITFYYIQSCVTITTIIFFPAVALCIFLLW